MKQLQVFCSRDLEGRVISAFDQTGVEAYLRVGNATGGKFEPQGQVPRTMIWEAALYVVPELSDAAIQGIAERLREYAGSCEIEPCLRIVVLPVETVI